MLRLWVFGLFSLCIQYINATNAFGLARHSLPNERTAHIAHPSISATAHLNGHNFGHIPLIQWSATGGSGLGHSLCSSLGWVAKLLMPPLCLKFILAHFRNSLSCLFIHIIALGNTEGENIRTDWLVAVGVDVRMELLAVRGALVSI